MSNGAVGQRKSVRWIVWGALALVFMLVLVQQPRARGQADPVEESMLVRTDLRAENFDRNFYLPETIPPVGSRVPTSNFVLNLQTPFSPEAEAAFESAVTILENIIDTDVPIVVEASWESLGEDILGSAGPYFGKAGADTAWRPGALRNHLAGSDVTGASGINPLGAEISLSFNSDFTDWHYGPGPAPAGKYDLVSVALHELIHGLGFAGSVQGITSTTARFGLSNGTTFFPVIYDQFTYTTTGLTQFITLGTAGVASTTIMNAVQGGSGGIQFRGPLAMAANAGQGVPLYTPATFNQGSSYSHLAESFNGTANALMTFSIGTAETVHEPGPVTRALLRDLGYDVQALTGGGTTDSVAWTGQPADRGVGIALPNLTVEARSGGVLNSSDNTTQITLSLDDQSSFRGGLEITGGNAPSGNRSAEVQALAAGRGHVRASFHDDGTLRSIAALDQPLTAASNDSPELIARTFLASISGLRGVDPGYDDNLRVQKVDDSPSGQVVVGFTQEVGGLPVFDAYAKVGMDAQGRVIAFSTELLGSGAIIAGPPVITAEQAVAAAESLVGAAPDFTGADDFTAQAANLFAPVVSLVAYETGAGLGVAYSVYIPTLDDAFTILVDAVTGAVVYQESHTAHVGPEGRVFTEHPDAGGRTLESFESQVAGQPKWTSDIGQGGGGGWTCPVFVPARPCLIGNNVAAIVARNGQFGGANPNEPVFITYTSSTDIFDFTFTDGWNLLGAGNGSTTGINVDIGATDTTLFYFNNIAHDWLHNLGFDAAAGNFQHNNFSQGGVALDSVTAFAQYGANFCDIPQSTCRNNANFSTPPDGFDGIMRMYLFDNPARRDGSLDGDVIIHEYGHGVSNRLIDAAQANGMVSHQSRSMGEGWSDFFSYSFFNDNTIGEYVSTNPDGIRWFTYDDHPWTYSHLCQTNLGQGPVCQEHRDGEIWAATLYVMRQNLMGSGYTSDDVVELVMDGLKITPEQPDYLDARDAIVTAATNSGFTAGQICGDIWAAFALKGIGFSAQSTNADDESVQDGFDLPPSCAGGGGGGANLTCTGGLTKTVSSGVATWTGCSVDTAGTYKIIADATGTPPNQLSAQFVIGGGGGGGGTPTQVGWATHPGNGVMNLPLTSQPSVQIRDVNGQLVTSSNATVTLSLVAPPTVQSPPVPADAASRRPIVGKDSLLPDLAREGIPTDEWAVWAIPGTDGSTLAASLGATYVEPSPSIADVHILRFEGASDLRNPAVVATLEASTLVTQYEQQVLKDTDLRTLPSDPGVANQWHIKNTGQGGRTPGVDVNVEGAWNLGYTGDGVVVAIVDDGFEHTHGDLSGNYNSGLSFDFLSSDTDPAPGVSDFHGTAVGGLVGASANNGVCGAGVAYDAVLAGLRGGGYALADATEAAMLGYLPQSIDVYNNSWGPSDSGTVLGEIPTQVLAAIQNSVATGRGGLGNIFVWAGGNGRLNSDNSNFDGYANLRQVIGVAAIEGSGIYSSYSEAGANLLISTPGGTLGGDIYTVDRTGTTGYNTGGSPGGDCTGGFNGTSAASPIAAGAIAVILEANPNLTWRDVQHILVNSATKVNPGDADWAVNGAGHDVNHNYGFGLLNTTAAVNLALGWNNVGPEISATSGLQVVGASIPDNNSTGVSRQVVMNGDLKVEHVELVFNAAHSWRGDLQVFLTSPSGTVSHLATVRPNDSQDNFTNWKFTSTRHWDEDMQGTWTVTVKDSVGGLVGTWTNYTLNFYGTADTGGGGPAVLTCDGGLSKAAVNGVASFTGCKVSGEGEGYKIVATSTGLTQSQSNTFNVTDPAYDATCNGSVDAADSLAFLRELAGYDTSAVVGPCTGNADGDGNLGLDDALLIRRKVAGFF